MLLRYKSYSYELVPVTEDYMIGKFLLAEIKSKRFSEKIHQAIGHLGLNEIVVTEPDFESKRNNQSRRSILEVTRKFTT